MPSTFVFRRPALASQLADGLLGDGPFTERAGMFLAAPRRTGKTTFLTRDFVPEVEARGALPIYVDLWSDRERDPGLLVADGIKAALRAAASAPVRAARAAGLSK